MAKADTSVKWFHSEMADAPALSGQPGKLIDLLDACLINGFSTRTPDGVVVADGVATVSISAGNPYEKHAVVAISGASDAALNSEWRIDTAGATSFTFLCPGVSNGTASGSSVKRAGAGWGKPFSDTMVAAYQSLDPSSTQLYLRVDDSTTWYADVRICETMTSVSEFANESPLLASISRWRKSSLSDASSRVWTIVSTSKGFFYCPNILTSDVNGRCLFFAGDFVSPLLSDNYNFLLTFYTSTSATGGHYTNTPLGPARSAGVSSGVVVARALNQVTRAVASEYSQAPNAGVSPSPPGNHVLLPNAKFTLFGQGSLSNGSGGVISLGCRGFVPALYIPNERVEEFKTERVFELEGEIFVVIPYNASSGAHGGSSNLISLTDWY